VLVVGNDPEVVEADLAAGRIACPDCGGRLGPWGFGIERELRTLVGVRRLRPRRSVCAACRATHVLEPAWTVARHRDSAEVIGAAWLAKAAGAGHRAIAERLGRSPSTVRRWLRRLAAGAEAPRVRALEWTHHLDANAGPIASAGSPLADALEAVGVAVAATARALGPRPAWELAVSLSGGLLVRPAPSRRGGVKGGPPAVPQGPSGARPLTPPGS